MGEGMNAGGKQPAVPDEAVKVIRKRGNGKKQECTEDNSGGNPELVFPGLQDAQVQEKDREVANEQRKSLIPLNAVSDNDVQA